MTFNPKEDWTKDEVQELLGKFVVSVHPSYQTLVLGHVHGCYGSSRDGYHVEIAWHDGKTRIPMGPKRPPRIDTVGYSRLEYELTLVPYEATIHMEDPNATNPCLGPRFEQLPVCPVRPKGF
jgi:hypothetical protein